MCSSDLAEANRASRANSSPWATLRDYGLLPFDEALFFEYLELAPHAEIPRGIYHHIASKLSPHHVLRGLLHGDKVADPMVAPWLDRMKELAAQQASTSFQRRQFAQFVRVMKQWKSQTSVPRLPKFRIGETNAWRAFVAMYPHALGMLKFVIEHSQREGDVIFAASMLPVLANSNDRRVEESAKDALQILRGREHDFEGYAFIREFWRSQAESGERDALDRVTDLVTRLETRDSERQFLRRYGWPESALEANLIRKLERPTFRDLNQRQMYDGMANALIRGK